LEERAMSHDNDIRLARMLDREELFDLVRRERFARDQRRFGVMRDCFADDAYVRTTWYDGHGGEAYVEATRAWMSKAGNSKHWVFPAYSKVAGDRATVESPSSIFNRAMIDGVEIDFYVFCRFFSRCVKLDGTWKIATFHVLFERDIMSTVNPAEPLPVDWTVLATLRPSYRFLAYTQFTRGVTVNQALLGDDRPDELAVFHAGEDAWLAEA
jgi:hypothetical protein